MSVTIASMVLSHTAATRFLRPHGTCPKAQTHNCYESPKHTARNAGGRDVLHNGQ